MSSEKQRVNSTLNSEVNFFKESEVSNFYNGKSVFITGAAGFLGSVILEILLKCCPGIKNIFILLRPKNNVKAEDRKSEIFKKDIFDKLKEENPDALKKVIAIPGDVTHANLGMNEVDLERAVKEISVVFHCAATISFSKPLSFTMTHNVIGTDNIIDFCHKLEKIEALIYSSTVFSNSNRIDIEEKIYRLPFKGEEAVELIRKGDLDGLDKLYASCNPPFLNFYTFSKCVTENLLAEKAYNLPVSIIRPSAITCCTKGSSPGYVEKGSAIVSFSLGIGKGILRVGRIYDGMVLPVITADIAANTHIVAAYLQATKSLPSPSVYNCTKVEPIQWDDWMNSLIDIVVKNPLPNSYLVPSVTLYKSELAFRTLSFIYHYIPAYIVDALLWLSGSDVRYVKQLNRYENALQRTKAFLNVKWSLGTENFKSLAEKLNSTDAKIFWVETKDFTVESLSDSLINGCSFFKVGNKPYKDTWASYLLRHFLTNLLRCFVLGTIALFFYFVLYKNLF